MSVIDYQAAAQLRQTFNIRAFWLWWRGGGTCMVQCATGNKYIIWHSNIYIYIIIIHIVRPSPYEKSAESINSIRLERGSGDCGVWDT